MPCKQIGAEVDRLSGTAPYNDLAKVKFYKCDVEVVEESQEHFGITVQTYEEILSLLQSYINPYHFLSSPHPLFLSSSSPPTPDGIGW